MIKSAPANHVSTSFIHTDTHVVEISVTYAPGPGTRVLSYRGQVTRLKAAKGAPTIANIEGCTTLNDLLRDIACSLDGT